MTNKLELKSSHEVIYTVDVEDVESIFYCKPTDPDILTVLMKDGKRLYCDEVCPVSSLQEEPVSKDLHRVIDAKAKELWAEMNTGHEYSILDSYNQFLGICWEIAESIKEEHVSIWHDANKQPTMYRKYLVRYSDGRVSGSWERHDNGFIPWEDVIKEHGFTHWCYVEDLIKL